MTLKVPRTEGTERQWRFPSLALQNEVFRAELQEASDEYFELNVGSVQSWAVLWEAFKAYARGVCISKHAGVLRDLRRTLTSIEQQLSLLDQEQARNPDQTTGARHLALLVEFKEVVVWEAHFLSKYSVAHRYGEGERPGRTLPWLLEPPSGRAYITNLRSAQGRIITGTPDIRDKFQDYCSSLYMTRDRHGDRARMAYLEEIA